MMFPKEIKIVIANIENRKKLYLGIAAAIFASAAVAFIPYIYGRLVDIAIAPGAQKTTIFKMIGLWLAISLASDWANRFSFKQSYEIATDLANKILVDIVYHILSLPMAFHKEKKSGKIMRQVYRGTDQLHDLMDRVVFSFLPALLSLLIALVILLFVQWRLSLILVASAAGYVLITLVYTKKIVEKQKSVHRGWEKAYGTLYDSMGNVHAIKSSSAEDFERKRISKDFNLAGRVFKNWRLIWIKMNIWQRAIFAFGFIAVFSTGIFMLQKGTLTPGTFIMFIGYTSLMTAPLAQLADQYRTAKSAITSFGRAVKYLDVPKEKDVPSAQTIDIKGKIVFQNVSFNYRKGKEILKDISFEVGVGQMVALVGESGVGKTTLADLIGRYIFPQSGRILIDGIEIRKIKLKSLRGQMAIVPQEVLLFNDTVKNNIGYGNPKATDEQIIEATKAANAHEFIESFPKKYEQIVGERGIKLSTGQKQRVAIARAILRDPKILILDEATSALDSASERLVQEALQKLIKGRTTFVIAHRLSTIMNADKIIVLEKGKIAEQGSHQELMQNPDGIYRNFWELQTAIQKIK